MAKVSYKPLFKTMKAKGITSYRLQKMGYKVTNVGDVVYKENYTIDRNGVQRLNAQ